MYQFKKNIFDIFIIIIEMKVNFTNKIILFVKKK